MRNVDYLDVIALATDKMTGDGAFLSVAGETPNTMTIGWGSIGYYWGKPAFIVIVRPQRHTHGLLATAGEFTVSVPTCNPLTEELRFAGTKSGAQYDKFNGHGITPAPAQCVSAPIVRECGLHFECKVRLMQRMDPEGMCGDILASAYPKGDMHTMFFGEIVTCYYTDG
jgi:flavin reductase (DIM6/NTAB) family NADH-FMN oxidoreductase RutF